MYLSHLLLAFAWSHIFRRGIQECHIFSAFLIIMFQLAHKLSEVILWFILLKQMKYEVTMAEVTFLFLMLINNICFVYIGRRAVISWILHFTNLVLRFGWLWILLSICYLICCKVLVRVFSLSCIWSRFEQRRLPLFDNIDVINLLTFPFNLKIYHI